MCWFNVLNTVAMCSIEPFDVGFDPFSVGLRWLKLFQNCLAAMNVTDDDRKKAITVAERSLPFLKPWTPPSRSRPQPQPMLQRCVKLLLSVHALQDYFSPRQNVDFEILVFTMLINIKTNRWHIPNAPPTTCRQFLTCQEIKSNDASGCYCLALRVKSLGVMTACDSWVEHGIQGNWARRLLCWKEVQTRAAGKDPITVGYCSKSRNCERGCSSGPKIVPRKMGGSGRSSYRQRQRWASSAGLFSILRETGRHLSFLSRILPIRWR